ncbi:hypothetical protein Tco_1132501 [Tanacetum coccineum]|uniref:Uncharacterized protein n=1 Tax=Tanacetum coccineum TaxID=301880 RepID=A0ABQ5JDH7_9ASTR
MQYYYVCSRLLLLEQLKYGWIDSLQELSTPGTSLKRPLSKGIVHHSRLLNDLKTSTTSSRKAMNNYTKLGNGPHLEKECPLNEEVKQVEEVKYGEFGRPAPFNGSNEAKFEESARRSAEMEEWIKKLQESAEINTRNQSASLKNLEAQIEQLTKELHSRTINEAPSSSTRQCKVVNADHETPNIPISSSKLNNLHGVSFLSDSDFQGNFTWGRYGGCQLNDLIWGQSYAEWIHKCERISKEGLVEILGYRLFRRSMDPDKDPMEISFDDYKWVFDLEIEQLADEYELGIGKKGHILERIWEKCKDGASVVEIRGVKGCTIIAIIYDFEVTAGEVGTADNIDHTTAEHNQVGCRLPAVEHCKPHPYAQTLPGNYPSDMTAYTPSSL